MTRHLEENVLTSFHESPHRKLRSRFRNHVSEATVYPEKKNGNSENCGFNVVNGANGEMQDSQQSVYPLSVPVCRWAGAAPNGGSHALAAAPT